MRRFIPLLFMVVWGCGGKPADDNPVVPMTEGSADDGVSRYSYLSADGGPHLLLPAAVEGRWKGVNPGVGVMDPKSDYGRACAAVSGAGMTTIPLGDSAAVVFEDPPMTACGTSPDGLTEIYILKSLGGGKLDDLIAKASAAVPTASMKETGKTIDLREPDAFLLFAGDTPTDAAYRVHRVAIPPGTYSLLTGDHAAAGEAVTIYRLKPAGR